MKRAPVDNYNSNHGLKCNCLPIRPLLLLLFSWAAATAVIAADTTLAELPIATIDTEDFSISTGVIRTVKADGDFQAALNAAEGGDEIVLRAGAIYTGTFRLPNKTGERWIIVRSIAAESDRAPELPDACRARTPKTKHDRLPAPGCRISPADAGLMPHLQSASGPVLVTEPGAHHFRFIGIEISPASGRTTATSGQRLRNAWASLSGGLVSAASAFAGQTLVQLGMHETSAAALPHHLIFERCYLHGDALLGARRGIAMNARAVAVVDSWLADFKEVGADSQAIAGWNGPGPFKIINNYIEASGENLMFGGADPSIGALVPSDIEIRANHFAKPLSWQKGHKDYSGTAWTIKNLLELKNARRVRIDGNLFEYSWPQAQDGFAILFTVRNQNNGAPWSVVSDVTFTNNIVRHVGNGIDILGYDDNFPSQQTRRIVIRNNLFDDIGGAWGGGRLLQLLDASADVSFQHNTAMQTGNIVTGGDHAPHRGFVFINNIVPHNAYGIIGSDFDSGLASLRHYFPSATTTDNVIIGGDAKRYPSPNYFPADLTQVGFVDRLAGDYRLQANSPYKRLSGDGRDLGIEFEEFCRAQEEHVVLISCMDRAHVNTSHTSLFGIADTIASSSL